MPEPTQVNHGRFPVDHVLYDDATFSVAWGTWDDGDKCLGMRWNGEGDDAGYPKLFQHPVWFIIPTNLSIPFTQSLLGQPSANNEAILAVLRELYALSVPTV